MMSSAEKRPDLRVIKTKKAIRSALIELLKQKCIEEITITDIAETAEINRKTFYSYYFSVRQLIDEIESEILASFDEDIERFCKAEALVNPQIIYQGIDTAINRNLELYGSFLQAKGNWGFISKVNVILKDKLKVKMEKEFDIPDYRLDVLLDFAIAGTVFAYQTWFSSPRVHSLEELIQIVSRLWFSILSDAVNTA